MDVVMRFPKPNRENIAMHLVEYQMHMIGKTYEDAESTPQWFREYTMTQEQFLEFKKYAVALLKKVYKCNKKIAESNFDWWNLNWGLRIFPVPQELVEMDQSLRAKIYKDKY